MNLATKTENVGNTHNITVWIFYMKLLTTLRCTYKMVTNHTVQKFT